MNDGKFLSHFFLVQVVAPGWILGVGSFECHCVIVLFTTVKHGRTSMLLSMFTRGKHRRAGPHDNVGSLTGRTPCCLRGTHGWHNSHFLCEGLGNSTLMCEGLLPSRVCNTWRKVRVHILTLPNFPAFYLSLLLSFPLDETLVCTLNATTTRAKHRASRISKSTINALRLPEGCRSLFV